MIKIDKELISDLSKQASKNLRKRKNHNFHTENSDPLQRMLNALQPGTYVRPHKHESPDKREVFIILKGKIAIIEFNNKGDVTDYTIADAAKENFGAEVKPGIWHMVICLEKDTVYYEVKDGPYDPDIDKDFASWSPAEGDKDAKNYIAKIIEHCKIKTDD